MGILPDKIPPDIIEDNKNIAINRKYSVNGKTVSLEDDIKRMQESTKIFGGETIKDYEKVGYSVHIIRFVDTALNMKQALKTLCIMNLNNEDLKTVITVEEEDCISVSLRLLNETGNKPLLLNLAQRSLSSVCGR